MAVLMGAQALAHGASSSSAFGLPHDDPVELDWAVAVVHSFLAYLGHLEVEADFAQQSLAQMGCEPREEHMLDWRIGSIGS
jgi:hypothetical protein